MSVPLAIGSIGSGRHINYEETKSPAVRCVDAAEAAFAYESKFRVLVAGAVATLGYYWIWPRGHFMWTHRRGYL